MNTTNEMRKRASNCKIKMLWNWNTIDACFLSRDWKITSKGMFAISCIGVALLVILLESLRRAAREYDAHLAQKCFRQLPQSVSQNSVLSDIKFWPTWWEQGIRAVLHMAQFAVAYVIMLLAMYYNGYMIISIFVGAFIGSYIFSWTPLHMRLGSQEVTLCCG